MRMYIIISHSIIINGSRDLDNRLLRGDCSLNSDLHNSGIIWLMSS